MRYFFSFLFLIYLVCVPALDVYSQTKDSSGTILLQEVHIEDKSLRTGISQLPDVKDNVIYAGKKTELIKLNDINADKSTNNARQIFAKVPGITIWENDGSGIQTSIAVRGLSPNRSWEFNVRQNGYDISAEVFGYPEAYYTPPSEAVESIELVRGAASLQFGPQMGGLLNYRLKRAPLNKPVAIDIQQTAGSYGLLNSFASIGGTYKKLSYYSFFQRRTADAWRENSRYQTGTAYLSLDYRFGKRIWLQAEYTGMRSVSQQAGGLTDLQFSENARQSNRSRNWMSTPWQVSALTLHYAPHKALSFQLKVFSTVAERNSVGYLRGINLRDSVQATTLQYNNRQIDRDNYNNLGSELRGVYTYSLAGKQHNLAAGARIYYGNTLRKQGGIGSTGDDADFTIVQGDYVRNLQFETRNAALFAENKFSIAKQILIVPGIRVENISASAKGYYSTASNGTLTPQERSRTFLLFGTGLVYKTSLSTQLYANCSRGYRPVTFSELTPSATSDVIDPNLKDASGYNVDGGFRGNLRNWLSFDVGAFYLIYQNRIGNIIRNSAVYRSNIGTSVAKGIEAYVEADIFSAFKLAEKFGNLQMFCSASLLDARYKKWDNPALQNNPLVGIENKQVEYAPPYSYRYGISYKKKSVSATIQASTIAAVYTDAANTENANAAATVGKLPGYTVADFSLCYNHKEKWNIKGGVNNLLDARYATRRAGGYPGPGLLPGAARQFYVGLGINI